VPRTRHRKIRPEKGPREVRVLRAHHGVRTLTVQFRVSFSVSPRQPAIVFQRLRRSCGRGNYANFPARGQPDLHRDRFEWTACLAPGVSWCARLEPPPASKILLRRKPEHLVLAGPFCRQVGEADNSHATRKASFDRRLDEVGREEGERDRHVDLADAAAVARRDACRISPWGPR
jgi:hypothetical protein